MPGLRAAGKPVFYGRTGAESHGGHPSSPDVAEGSFETESESYLRDGAQAPQIVTLAAEQRVDTGHSEATVDYFETVFALTAPDKFANSGVQECPWRSQSPHIRPSLTAQLPGNRIGRFERGRSNRASKTPYPN